MKTNKRLFCHILLWLIISLILNNTVITHAILTQSLIMEAGNEYNDHQLILYNSDTRAASIFYKSALSNVSLAPIVWSPFGDKILIKQNQNNDGILTAIYCILDRTGKLSTCLDEPGLIEDDVAVFESITWYPDGKYVQYLSQDQNKFRLIKADAVTGKTIEVLYSYEVDYGTLEGSVPLISSSAKTNFIVWGINNDRATSTQLLPEVIDLKSLQRRPFKLANFAQSDFTFNVCPKFSPQGTYLSGFLSTFQNAMTAKTRLIINDQGLNVLKNIDLAGLRGNPSCPSWNNDETKVYIYTQFTYPALTEGSGVYTFDLKTNQMVQAGKLPKYNITGNLAISSDDAEVAFSVDITINEETLPRAVYILKDGIANRIPIPYKWSTNPIWIPSTTLP